MKKILLLGDEAIAQGAIDAGLSGVYAYPGTPSTEITEYIQDYCCNNPEEEIHCRWCTNEKTNGGCARHVLCRQACACLYETCGDERGGRSLS